MTYVFDSACPKKLFSSYNGTAYSTEDFAIREFSRLIFKVVFINNTARSARLLKPQAWANVTNFTDPVFVELEYDYEVPEHEVHPGDSFAMKWDINTQNIPEVYRNLTLRPMFSWGAAQQLYLALPIKSLSVQCEPARHDAAALGQFIQLEPGKGPK
ncbi:hypothetical protein [Pseudomonas sp. NUPR-001]|uniref:hypothetical protein n=1 Tax=Pseudomonas sp. NUPR-001 TaxID=3416058 RepID=UPI003F94AFB9